jgi:hypothetical protein
VSRPALTVLRGAGSPAPARSLAAHWVECAQLDDLELVALERARDSANRQTTLEQLCRALDELRAIRDQRIAADRRLRRAQLEADGLRWLKAVRGG